MIARIFSSFGRPKTRAELETERRADLWRLAQDLKAQEEHERAQYARLKAKFEGGS